MTTLYGLAEGFILSRGGRIPLAEDGDEIEFLKELQLEDGFHSFVDDGGEALGACCL